MINLLSKAGYKTAYLVYLIISNKTQHFLEELELANNQFTKDLDFGSDMLALNPLAWASAFCGNLTIFKKVIEKYRLKEFILDYFCWYGFLNWAVRSGGAFDIEFFYSFIKLTPASDVGRTGVHCMIDGAWEDILQRTIDNNDIDSATDFINSHTFESIGFIKERWMRVLLGIKPSEYKLSVLFGKCIPKDMSEKIIHDDRYKAHIAIEKLAQYENFELLIKQCRKYTKEDHVEFINSQIGWHSIAKRACERKNFNLCKEIILYCQLKKINIRAHVLVVKMIDCGDNKLFYDLLFDQYGSIKSDIHSGHIVWHEEVIRAALAKNNIELFKRVINMKNFKTISFDTLWGACLCSATHDVNLLQEVVKCSIASSVAYGSWANVLKDLIEECGIISLLEFAVFAEEKGFFDNLYLSKRILKISHKLQENRRIHCVMLDKVTIGDRQVPLEISDLILQFTGLLNYKQLANKYPDTSKIGNYSARSALYFYNDLNGDNSYPGYFVEPVHLVSTKANSYHDC